jgi:hypothetical protein
MTRWWWAPRTRRSGHHPGTRPLEEEITSFSSMPPSICPRRPLPKTSKASSPACGPWSIPVRMREHRVHLPGSLPGGFRIRPGDHHRRQMDHLPEDGRGHGQPGHAGGRSGRAGVRDQKTADPRVAQTFRQNDPLHYYGSDAIHIKKLIRTDPGLGEKLHRGSALYQGRGGLGHASGDGPDRGGFSGPPQPGPVAGCHGPASTWPPVARLMAGNWDMTMPGKPARSICLSNWQKIIWWHLRVPAHPCPETMHSHPSPERCMHIHDPGTLSGNGGPCSRTVKIQAGKVTAQAHGNRSGAGGVRSLTGSPA